MGWLDKERESECRVGAFEEVIGGRQVQTNLRIIIYNLALVVSLTIILVHEQ